jgi:DNA ligase I, ATP-dependent (dnl1)
VNDLLYADLVKIYEKVEKTSKRLEMTGYLVDLFRATPVEIIDRVVYLTQGKLYPDFMGVELGMAEKLSMKAISLVSGVSIKDLEEIRKEIGDLGLVTEVVIDERTTEPLTVEKVYEDIGKIASTGGSGSQKTKIDILRALLRSATPKEGKFILKTVTGKLRLGIGDMTIIDALSIAFAHKSDKKLVERAYNLHPDLGAIARSLSEGGIGSLSPEKFGMIPGIPVKSMLAERLPSIEEIIDKMRHLHVPGCALEYKYDGIRIQGHFFDKEVKLFSRRLEDLTDQFPDIKESLRESFLSEDGIVEGECVAMNTDTDEMLPFQEVSHRRGRKHGIVEAIEDYPVTLYLFDCLYVDGRDLTNEDYLTRRERLTKIIEPSDKIRISDHQIVKNSKDFEQYFEEAIQNGCEGVVAKSTESAYEAGARGWNWIKYKREYKSEMTDTVDLVVIGAFAGRGRRAGTYGALLMVSYDPEEDRFETVCKLGTGFDDETLIDLPERLRRYRIEEMDKSVISKIEADYWFTPAIVMEVLGAEMTLSPIHTCAFGEIRKNSGLAIRFPRFTGRWRDDKDPGDATTKRELIEMYGAQLKHIGKDKRTFGS